MTVFYTTGWTKTAFTAERNKFHVAAVGTDIHGTVKGRVTTINHPGDVIHLNISGVKCIFNDFIIVFKNLL